MDERALNPCGMGALSMKSVAFRSAAGGYDPEFHALVSLISVAFRSAAGDYDPARARIETSLSVPFWSAVGSYASRAEAWIETQAGSPGILFLF